MASRFPTAWLDELCARADIVQTISGYTPLKKSGSRYWGLCPFHGEKTASFSVSSDPPLYYCFGCKAGGNVIHFVKEMEHLEYMDAVRLLADRVHMPLPMMEEDADYERRRSLRERLLAANKDAARFYHETLFTPAGAASLEYLRKRGLSDGVIRKFGLGASPDDWDACTRYLHEKGYSENELQLCGLTVVKEAENGKPKRVFDMFRNRAMFPIIDQFGNVLAFGGRSLDGKQPKYLNTSDTPVFNKRKGVYAANLLKKERHLDRVILVEGYMDVVSLVQYGVVGVCATLGTALTNEQAQLLHRFAPKVYLGYDGDSAGQHAILRGLDILAAENVPARVLDFPDGLDPDEFIRRDGPEGFRKLPAINPETYRMRRLKEQFDLSTEDGRKEYAKACAPLLQGLDPIDQESLLQALQIQTGFSRDVLYRQMEQSPPKPAPETSKPVQSPSSYRVKSNPTPVSEETKAQETLISLIATGRVPDGVVEENDFTDESLRVIFKELRSGVSPGNIVDPVEDPETRSRLTRLLLEPVGQNTDELITMATDCVNALRRVTLTRRLAEIKQELTSCDPDQRGTLLAESVQLTARLNKLKPGH